MRCYSCSSLSVRARNKIQWTSSKTSRRWTSPRRRRRRPPPSRRSPPHAHRCRHQLPWRTTRCSTSRSSTARLLSHARVRCRCVNRHDRLCAPTRRAVDRLRRIGEANRSPPRPPIAATLRDGRPRRMSGRARAIGRLRAENVSASASASGATHPRASTRLCRRRRYHETAGATIATNALRRQVDRAAWTGRRRRRCYGWSEVTMRSASSGAATRRVRWGGATRRARARRRRADRRRHGTGRRHRTFRTGATHRIRALRVAERRLSRRHRRRRRPRRASFLARRPRATSRRRRRWRRARWRRARWPRSSWAI